MTGWMGVSGDVQVADREQYGRVDVYVDGGGGKAKDEEHSGL